MIYEVTSPYYHSFLSGAGQVKAAFGGGGTGNQPKAMKAKGSDGKYQGE